MDYTSTPRRSRTTIRSPQLPPKAKMKVAMMIPSWNNTKYVAVATTTMSGALVDNHGCDDSLSAIPPAMLKNQASGPEAELWMPSQATMLILSTLLIANCGEFTCVALFLCRNVKQLCNRALCFPFFLRSRTSSARKLMFNINFCFDKNHWSPICCAVA